MYRKYAAEAIGTFALCFVGGAPAVTLAFVVTGRMAPVVGVRYVAAQVLGGLFAAVLLAAVVGAEPVAAGTPALNANVDLGAGIVIQAVATFFLVLVIFGTAVDGRAPKGIFPFAIASRSRSTSWPPAR